MSKSKKGNITVEYAIKITFDYEGNNYALSIKNERGKIIFDSAGNTINSTQLQDNLDEAEKFYIDKSFSALTVRKL